MLKLQQKAGNGNFEIRETDHRVGQILDALDTNGISDNTIVIFSSDNGAETNYVYQKKTHGHHSNLHFKGGKRDIYEGGHRVPFVIRWPAVMKPGIQIDTPGCQTDYLATIADILDVSLNQNEC